MSLHFKIIIHTGVDQKQIMRITNCRSVKVDKNHYQTLNHHPSQSHHTSLLTDHKLFKQTSESQSEATKRDHLTTLANERGAHQREVERLETKLDRMRETGMSDMVGTFKSSNFFPRLKCAIVQSTNLLLCGSNLNSATDSDTSPRVWQSQVGCILTLQWMKLLSSASRGLPYSTREILWYVKPTSAFIWRFTCWIPWVMLKNLSRYSRIWMVN